MSTSDFLAGALAGYLVSSLVDYLRYRSERASLSKEWATLRRVQAYQSPAEMLQWERAAAEADKPKEPPQSTEAQQVAAEAARLLEGRKEFAGATVKVDDTTLLVSIENRTDPTNPIVVEPTTLAELRAHFGVTESPQPWWRKGRK